MKVNKIWAILLITSMILLVGCNSEHGDRFNNFIIDDIVEYEEGVKTLNLPSGHKIESPLFFLNKEKENYRPKVVLDASFLKNDDWFLNIYDVKEDMKYLSELVIKYAEKKKWKNDYYLYVKINLNGTLGDFVYDYETDKLYVPNRYEDYLRLHRRFKTFSIDRISETDEGVDFLVENEMGSIVHNKFEYNLFWLDSYSIYISKGVFSQYNLSNSYVY